MLAIQAGTILTPTETIRDGVLVVDDGKIQAMGSGIPIPEGAEVIDARDQFVLPGLIDAHCHTGLFTDGVGMMHSDGNEMTDPVTPHMRAIDAIHPEDMAFQDLREAGITTIGTGPGSGNLIGGQTAAIKTRGRTIEEMLLRFPVGMKMALGENPKRVYGEQKKMPSTRMGNAATLRDWLIKARNYAAKKAQHARQVADAEAGVDGAKDPGPFEADLRLEELARVLDKEMPAHIHAHRADDIMTAIRIAEEFDLDFILIHATEGYKVADVLAEKGVVCIPGPVLFSRMKYELRGMTPENAGALANAGVKVAIQTDEFSAVKYLTLNAALAVSFGMPEGEALRAITLTPAEILGVADRVGSLEPGKDADIVIFSAHPFDVTHARVERVLIEGETIYERTT